MLHVKTIDLNDLPSDAEALKRILIDEVSKRDERIAQLEHENHLLRKEVFAPNRPLKKSCLGEESEGDLKACPCDDSEHVDETPSNGEAGGTLDSDDGVPRRSRESVLQEAQRASEGC